MIKNLIVNRSDLEALIRDYYEREEMKEFGQIERYGRLSFDEFMAECGCDFTTSTDNSYISLGNGRPNTSSSKTQTGCLSMVTSVR